MDPGGNDDTLMGQTHHGALPPGLDVVRPPGLSINGKTFKNNNNINLQLLNDDSLQAQTNHGTVPPGLDVVRPPGCSINGKDFKKNVKFQFGQLKEAGESEVTSPSHSAIQFAENSLNALARGNDDDLPAQTNHGAVPPGLDVVRPPGCSINGKDFKKNIKLQFAQFKEAGESEVTALSHSVIQPAENSLNGLAGGNDDSLHRADAPGLDAVRPPGSSINGKVFNKFNNVNLIVGLYK